MKCNHKWLMSLDMGGNFSYVMIVIGCLQFLATITIAIHYQNYLLYAFAVVNIFLCYICIRVMICIKK